MQSLKRTKPPQRVAAFPGAKRLVKTLPAMKSKKSGYYKYGARVGKENTSTTWAKGQRRGKIFNVTSSVAIEIGARYVVKATGKNSFVVLKRHR